MNSVSLTVPNTVSALRLAAQFFEDMAVSHEPETTQATWEKGETVEEFSKSIEETVVAKPTPSIRQRWSTVGRAHTQSW
jgi:hypothetical protein